MKFAAVPNFLDDLVGNLDSNSAFRGMAEAGLDWEIVPGFLIGARGDYNFGQELGFKERDSYIDDLPYIGEASYKIQDMWTVAGRSGLGD